MTTIRRSGGTLSGCRQTQTGTSSYICTSGGLPIQGLTLQAHTTAASARNIGVAFDSISIPQGTYIRDAQLIIYHDYSGSSATGARYNLSAHKIGTVPAFKSTSTSGTNDLNSRLGAKTIAQINVNRPEPYTAADRKVVHDVTAMVQELVSQSDWLGTANNMIFMFHASNASIEASFVQGAGWTDRPDIWPELYINYGNLDDDAFDFDLAIFGDSHAVCAGQAGAQRFNIPITAPYWDAVIEETYAGMIGDSPFGGDLFGNGDQKRGYSPGGLVQDYFEVKYPNRVQIYRGEFALGGTMMESWWYKKFVQQAEPDSPPPYIYNEEDSTGPDTTEWVAIDAFLSNPSSVNRRMFLWWSALGNDVIHLGTSNGTTRTLVPRGSSWDTYRDIWIEKMHDLFTHILGVWEDNDVDGYILLPGYQNFTVMAPEPTSGAGIYKYPPTGGAACDQMFERDVWSTSGYGVGYAQADYDGITATFRAGWPDDPTDPDDPWILSQSTYIKAAIWKQIDDYGAFSTSAAGGLQWNAALNWAGTVPGVSGPTWYRSFGAPVSRNLDCWKDLMRNIDDITVNTYMIEETNIITQAAIDMVVEANPDAESRFMFFPNGDVHGPDTVNSADPDSYLAQPPRATTVRTDGIHPTMERFDVWVQAYVDWLGTRVPFLPDYIQPRTADFFNLL